MARARTKTRDHILSIFLVVLDRFEKNVSRIINNCSGKLELQYKMHTIFITCTAIILFKNKDVAAVRAKMTGTQFCQRTHFEKVRLPREH